MAKKKSKAKKTAKRLGGETIRLDLVESVLYRETSCVAHEDVPLIMSCLYEEVGLPVPAGIAEEIRENARARGDE
jgi:hypothetical protein